MMFMVRAWKSFQCHYDGVVYYGLSMGLIVGVHFILSSLFSAGEEFPKLKMWSFFSTRDTGCHKTILGRLKIEGHRS